MPRINFIHPPEFKKWSRDRKIENAPLPSKVAIHILQHSGAAAEPVVNIGDRVKTGSLLASLKGFISSNIHSSISGHVVKIEDVPHPVFGRHRAIIIESDGRDEKIFPEVNRENSLSLKREELLDIIKDAGIVGLGGAMFPTHVKLMPPPQKKIDTYIVNGAECEPFLSCDHASMLEKANELILGIDLVANILGVKNVMIGIEENKLDAIELITAMVNRLNQRMLKFKIVGLKTRYPQGGEKQLIKTLLDREVPSGGLPMDVGCIVNNVQTVISIYEAVYVRKPLFERVITVSGNLLKEPRNLRVRIGTYIREILEYCGVKEAPYKIIMGGPMTGVAQYTLDVPVIKGTSGIIVLDNSFKIDKEMDCIRCGRCIEACPMGLMPCMLGLTAKKGRFDMAISYSPLDCIECGACSYVCPAKIPLTQYIKLAKMKLAKKNI